MPGEELMRFTTPPVLLGLTAALVAAAFLVNRYAPKKRPHVRRTVIVHLLYLAAYGARFLFLFLAAPGSAHVAREVAEVLGVLSVVNIGALALFDVGLPALGVELATILTDIAIGLGYIIAVLASMRRFGVDLSGIVTTSALMTTIIAFSLQSTLSNVVGGVALQLDNSIHAGDWIQLENGRTGKVKEVRWRYTTIETRDWGTLIVPNATLLAQTFMILGKRDGEAHQHRYWVYFNVDFRYPPSEVIQAVNDALQAAPIEGVAGEPKPHCICMDFAKDNRDSFAYYAARFWITDLARDDPTCSRVRERIFAALKRARIPLAVPAATIWVEQDDQEHRERKRQREQERRRRALASVELLGTLHEDELTKVAENLRYAPFAAGETITKQGAVAHWLYIVQSGSAEVRIDVDGAQKVVATIAAPGFFGEMGLMTGEPRTATVVACNDVECYRLDKEAFHKIISERPEIAHEISELLAQRRVGLQAAKEDLDAEAKQRRVEAEKNRILSTIQSFFGLGDSMPPTSRRG
jgi:CRP-like cAMP-binding protein/small-conductance mechanosensitive channel